VVTYSAACNVARACFGAIQNAAGRFEQKVGADSYRDPPDRQRARDADDGDDQRDGADVVDPCLSAAAGSRRALAGKTRDR